MYKKLSKRILALIIVSTIIYSFFQVPVVAQRYSGAITLPLNESVARMLINDYFAERDPCIYAAESYDLEPLSATFALRSTYPEQKSPSILCGDAKVELLTGKTLITWNAENIEVIDLITFSENPFKTYSEQFRNSILMYVDAPSCYVFGRRTYVDSHDKTVKPLVIDGRTLVPARFIAESLGGTIDWDTTSQTVTIKYQSNSIRIAIGINTMFLNDQAINLDVPAQIINGRTLVPLRALAEALDKSVYFYDGLVCISDEPLPFDNENIRAVLMLTLLSNDLIGNISDWIEPLWNETKKKIDNLMRNLNDSDRFFNIDIIPNQTRYFNNNGSQNQILLDIGETIVFNISVDGNVLSPSDYYLKSGNIVSVNENKVTGKEFGITTTVFYDTNTDDKLYTLYVIVIAENGNIFKAETAPKTFEISGMLIDNFSYTENGEICTLKMDIHNTLEMYGAVDVYDKNGEWLYAERIHRMDSYATNIWDSVIGGSMKIIDGIKNNWDVRSDILSKKTHLEIDVPKGGVITVSNNIRESDSVALFNAVTLAFDTIIATYDWASFGIDAKNLFTSDVRDFVIKEVVIKILKEDAAKKSIIKIVELCTENFSFFNTDEIVREILRELNALNIDWMGIIWSAALEFGKTNLITIGEGVFKTAAGPIGLVLDALFNFNETLSVVDQFITMKNMSDAYLGYVFMPNSILRLLEEERGNTVGNIVNRGLVGLHDEWVYSGNVSDHGKLCKFRVDGSDKQNLSDNIPYSINVVGDWVYYLNMSDGYSVYRTHTAGGVSEKLNNEKSDNINVVGDWVYYSNYDDGNKIYKIRVDGSDRSRLNTDMSSYLNVVDGWVYYSNGDDNGKLYKINADGNEKQKLNDDVSQFINVTDEWIYYSNGGDGNKLYKIRTDGSERQLLNDTNSTYLNVVQDWVYYSNGNDGNKLYKIQTDGHGQQKLSDDSSFSINVVGDWVYYTNGDDYLRFYKIRIDGMERQYVD